MTDKIKIFIIHGKEDKAVAKQLYDDLKACQNIEPFMEDDVLAGENIEMTMRRNIRKSNYVLAVMSEKTLSERSLFQKNLKLALNILDEFPDNQIYLIPVRIDECEPADERLQQRKPADLFPDYHKGLNEILRSFGSASSQQQTTPKSKFKLAIYAILAYFVLLPLLWCFLHEKDWWFYTKIPIVSKTPELSNDVVLIDIPYHDKVNFRERIGLFLQYLAQDIEIPSVIGLDIIYKKFDAENEQTKEATAELIKGIKLLTAKGVPVIAGYDPGLSEKDYDTEVLNAVTDIGHNLIHVSNGKFHASIYETKKSSSYIGLEIIPFFAVKMVQDHFFRLCIIDWGSECICGIDWEGYTKKINRKYHNIILSQYQKSFEFMQCYPDSDKASSQICTDRRFGGKMVIIGNFEKDFKEPDDFFGIHAIGYAVQMLADQAKGKDILIAIEDREWVIGLFGLVFSMVEVALYALIFYFFKKFGMIKRSILSLLLSILISAILFLCVMMLKNDKLFADISVVISGILSSAICIANYELFRNPDFGKNPGVYSE